MDTETHSNINSELLNGVFPWECLHSFLWTLIPGEDSHMPSEMIVFKKLITVPLNSSMCFLDYSSTDLKSNMNVDRRHF